jgi:predicted DNA repair protein MutK
MMASGLAALLDDVAGIARVAAASLDDVAGAAGKASAKAAGVVIDDTAVSPRYVVGFAPDRELPIIARIAIGSLRNKLLLLLPAAIALSAFAPWAITPLLMTGGAYLCFEGAEKVLEILFHHESHDDTQQPIEDPAHLERSKVKGAIRTDLILSGEIMAIALAEVAAAPLLTQAAALATVGVLVTVGVYGVVALIVKMDDVGLHLAGKASRAAQLIGRGLVKAMPPLLTGLAGIGTAAMMWVGGGILVHGLDHFGVGQIAAVIHHMAEIAGRGAPIGGAVAEWFVIAISSAIVGLMVGSAIATVIARVKQSAS